MPPQEARLAAAYERHHDALYRYCRSIVRHDQDAQDAVQNAMTSALASLEARPREVELRPWLFRIAHNEAVSILRGRRLHAELDAHLPAAGALEERVEANETLRLLRQDFADLPERQRTALVLRELHGLAPAEIAERMGTTTGAVKQAVLEARRALSNCREGRATSCFDVQRTLSDGDGRVARARKLRAHLRACGSCRRFHEDLRRRPRELSAVAPSLPVGGALAAALQVPAGGGAAGLAAGMVAKVAIVAVVAAGVPSVVPHGRERQPVPPPVVPAVAPPDSGSPAVPSITPYARDHPRTERPSAPAAVEPRRRDPWRSGTEPRRPEPVVERADVPAAAERAEESPAETPARLAPADVPAPAVPAPVERAEAPSSVVPAPVEPTEESTSDVPQRADVPAPDEQAAAPAPSNAPAPDTSLDQPPGQAKKEAVGAPPGQAKKEAAPPPGQAKKDAVDAPPPGQAKKDAPDAPPPGQAKKDAEAPPPGHGTPAAGKEDAAHARGKPAN